jgi:hypothetical protein
MKELVRNLDSLERRRFLSYAASASLGVGLFPELDKAVAAAESVSAGKAKRVIYLFMTGGMSHIDTFDLKPGHENQGSTKGIATSVPGCQISQHLPLLASQFDKMAVIRSMTTQTGDHEGGEYLMRTSYEAIATERHPSLGPWMQKLQGRNSKSLPDTVMISPTGRHPGPGFLDPSMSPLPIADPNRGLENTKPPQYLTDKSYDKRIELINKFDSKFQKKFKDHGVKTYTDLYTEATALLASNELLAFDLSKEKNEDRDRYGRDAFGQGCLLARRLIENYVRCVEVNFGNWDMHTQIFGGNALPSRAAVMDKAVGNLMKDLSERGLLKDTLIVLTTEFGRSPAINYNVGRDHHPAVFSSMLAGAGIRGGQFYGASDAAGFNVEKDGVSPADFNATVAKALGLSLDEIVISPTGRPFKVANDGTPISALLG